MNVFAVRHRTLMIVTGEGHNEITQLLCAETHTYYFNHDKINISIFLLFVVVNYYLKRLQMYFLKSFSRPKNTMKYVLNACVDTLSTKVNVKRWGKATNDMCHCGKRQTLNHILNCCQISLK